jgi:Domain of unknown function (DUF397)
MNHTATNPPGKQALNATWRKSCRSGSGGGGSGSGCVEVTTTSNGRIGVRDSRNPTGETLPFFSLAQWAHLIHEIKTSNLDSQ